MRYLSLALHPSEQTRCHFPPKKCYNVLQQASGVCVPSFLAIPCGCTSKFRLTYAALAPDSCQKHQVMGHIAPYIPMAPSTFQKCMSKWFSNRFGPAWTATTTNIRIPAFVGPMGRWKVTTQGSGRVLRDLVARGPIATCVYRWELIFFQVKENLKGYLLCHYLVS